MHARRWSSAHPAELGLDRIEPCRLGLAHGKRVEFLVQEIIRGQHRNGEHEHAEEPDGRVRKRNCNRHAYACPPPPVSERPGSPSPPTSRAGAGSRSVPISFSRDCCSGPCPRARKSASSTRETCPPEGRLAWCAMKSRPVPSLHRCQRSPLGLLYSSLVRMSFIASFSAPESTLVHAAGSGGKPHILFLDGRAFAQPTGSRKRYDPA